MVGVCFSIVSFRWMVLKRRIGDGITGIHSSVLRPQSLPTAGASQCQVAQFNLTSEEEALFFLRDTLPTFET